MTGRMLSGALLVTVGALLLAGCGGSSSSAPPPPPPTGVTGTASSTAGGALDEYVVLTFTLVPGGTEFEFTSAADGSYLALLAAGTYDLNAWRPGYDSYDQAGIVVADTVVVTVDFALAPLAAGEYVGSYGCGLCHTTNYSTFLQTGHPFKLNEVMDGMEPLFPFTTIGPSLAMIADDNGETDNSLGTPMAWGDISYVIGGFGWKCRFIDLDGYIVTGSEVQYNFFTGAMSAYHNDEVDKPYNCGNCHTTGWRHTDPTLNPVGQGGLAGMQGTFAETGIGCEACHGAGSLHAQTSNPLDIPAQGYAPARTTAQMLAADQGYGLPVACGECHTRDGERDYRGIGDPDNYVSNFELAGGTPYMEMGGRIDSSGTPELIRHHEQFDELFGIDPDDVAGGSTRTGLFLTVHGNCSTCHDPHTTTIFQDISGDPPGFKTTCESCHPGNVITSGGMTGLACIDCHMPLLAKSATLTFDPTGTDRPPEGDIRTHIFRIDLSAAAQFSSSWALPAITGEFACRRCHSDDGPSFNIDFPNGMTIH